MMLHRIYLAGRLKTKFGGPYEFFINTPADAIRALTANFPAFASEFQKGVYRFIVGSRKKGDDIDPDLLEFGLPSGKNLHIVPVAAGRKGGGTGKMIIGIAAFSVAMVMSGGTAAGLAAPLGSGLFSGISWGGIAVFGAAMALAGVAQMLTPTPKAPNMAEYESNKDSPSFLLGGAVNTTEQGNAIPIVLGKIRTGGVVISGGISIERIPV